MRGFPGGSDKDKKVRHGRRQCPLADRKRTLTTIAYAAFIVQEGYLPCQASLLVMFAYSTGGDYDPAALVLGAGNP